MKERIVLAMGRIRLIPEDTEAPDPFHDFFCAVSEFLLRAEALGQELETGQYRKRTLEEMKELQDGLYRDMLPSHYESSWLNPDYAWKRSQEGTKSATQEPSEGEDRAKLGVLLSALYAELYGVLRFLYEGRSEDIAPMLELFLQIHGLFSGGEIPDSKEVKDAFYWYAFDYLDVLVPERTRELLIPEPGIEARLFHGFEREDLRYLFFSGDYISESTLQLASFLNALPEEKLELAARSLTEGFAEGFRVMGRTLSEKKTVVIRFLRGFERLVLREAELFAEKKLQVILPSAATRLTDRIPGRGDRQLSLSPNRQFEYDHRFDAAIFWDKAFTDRRHTELQASYEARREAASQYAGPAVMEYFGEDAFFPAVKQTALSFSPKQRKLLNRCMAEQGELTERYMPGDETSFSMIAWPVPEIGPQFPQIFEDTIEINSGDNRRCKELQQKLIDVLDRCDHVEVRGRNGNETNLRIALRKLEDPDRETRFENCAADVNIPAGEVFTSPVLAGTNGLLHVSRVYIDGLLFRDLKLHFSEGRTTEVSCANFESEEENRRFVTENLMGSYEVLPMGEFAIGTNTAAFAFAKRYGIEEKMPILIAEKTGPHVAVGDTCYSHEEDTMTYNPDGKAIVARDNEISARRRESPEEAYFGHHKDITLPYEELGVLSAVMPDGSRVDLLRDGLFSLPGLEELNEPITGLGTGSGPETAP